MERVFLAQIRSYHKFQDGNKDRHRAALFHLTNCLENQAIPEKLLLFEKCTANTQVGWVTLTPSTQDQTNWVRSEAKAKQATQSLMAFSRKQNLSEE